jgi:hypothetical protein
MTMSAAATIPAVVVVFIIAVGSAKEGVKSFRACHQKLQRQE